jgi:DeoR family transcriptional regulator, deoxyribose operon repressor
MGEPRSSRVEKLSRTLAQRGVLHLREAASLLGVSEMTIRRDVAANRDQFAYLGGHIVSAADVAGGEGYVLDQEADSHAEAKAAACARALSLIAPEDTIFLDCGTTIPYLAEKLPDDIPLTVVCYALNVANRLAAKPNVRMILLGGLYHVSSATFGGPDAVETMSRFGINKAFVSAGGVDRARGVSCSHFHEVPIKKAAIATALESHLVVDASKIGRVRPAVFAALSDFRFIISEEGMTSAQGTAKARLDITDIR